MINDDGRVVLNTPGQIAAYQHLARRRALYLEIATSLKVSRGRSMSSIVKEVYGLKGRGMELLRKFEDWIDKNLIMLDKRYTSREGSNG